MGFAKPDSNGKTLFKVTIDTTAYVGKAETLKGAIEAVVESYGWEMLSYSQVDGSGYGEVCTNGDKTFGVRYFTVTPQFLTFGEDE